MSLLTYDKMGFYFAVAGALVMNFSDKHTLVLAVVGVLFLVSNISWIAHARLKGEKYLGLQNKVFILTSSILIINSLSKYLI